MRENNKITFDPSLQGYMTEQHEPCLICECVTLWRRGKNPYFIHEFEHSIFVIGDHQFHGGYSLILLKKHIRELHELAPPIQSALFQEVMLAGQAIVNAFSPSKINYACYGNSEPHIHWHLFPRDESDPDRQSTPWLHASEFKHHLITPQTAQNLGKKVKEHLSLLITR
ncbi:HIT family protein [Nostoc sp.]|uniref:HIT family protein n=1 Tax=Nostoc sp. TaxID=1180 RepID=UPI002FF73473